MRTLDSPEGSGRVKHSGKALPKKGRRSWGSRERTISHDYPQRTSKRKGGSEDQWNEQALSKAKPGLELASRLDFPTERAEGSGYQKSVYLEKGTLLR
jgi:hypothetical protein